MNRRLMINVIALCLLNLPMAWSQAFPPSKPFTMVLTGDCIITRKLSVYREPEFLKMIDLIRSADVALTNLEMLFHDYEPYPMNQSGGTYMRADPALAEELVWAGFDMVSRANNHTGDYGTLGMRLTTKYINQAGLIQAGVGESLTEAREAKFLETSQARVALISCASTFPDHCRAGKTRGDIPARPGLNPLRYSITYAITEDQFRNLQEISSSLGMGSSDDREDMRFLGRSFILGKEAGVQTEPNKEDLEEIAHVVHNAGRLADYTLVTFHGHEYDRDRNRPAQFLITFARAMIDAGADVVFGHGPHILQGIEIYKGKPILYSLANFMFQNETLLRLPYENYERYNLGADAHVADFNDARYDHDRRGFPARPEIWESIIAVPCWEGKTLTKLELYPITLGYGTSRTERGRPRFTDEELGKKIIRALQTLSEPYGTNIDYKEGIGIVKLK